MSKAKKLRIKDRIQILKPLLLQNGLEIRELNWYHFRIFGNQTVDYWPSTGRAWVYGTDCKAVVQVTPQDVVAIALHRVLPEGALEHMKSL